MPHHAERLARLRGAFTSQECGGFFSASPDANQYFTGFRGTTSALVLTADDAALLVDSRYTEQAREQVSALPVEERSGVLARGAGEWLRARGVARVGFDAAEHTVSVIEQLRGAAKAEAVGLDPAASQLRIVKDSEEIAAIRAASALAEGVLADVLPTLAAGVREREVAATIEYEFKRRGAAGTSFDTIVLFGARSSLPHGMPGDTPLQPGDIVLIDMGCRHGGYCSDLTRTYVFGSLPDSWFETVYGVVREAQQRALDTVRAGVEAREADAAARTLIAEAGYGEYFGHGLGHGVGIAVHEGPRLNRDSDTVLAPGMVVTVEPGVYLPGQGGVRIEDLVVVTERGCDVLTRTPKALEILGR